jgi:hypothetical protein
MINNPPNVFTDNFTNGQRSKGIRNKQGRLLDRWFVRKSKIVLTGKNKKMKRTEFFLVNIDLPPFYFLSGIV